MLHVTARPMFDPSKIPRNMNGTVGKTVSFDCDADSNTKPKADVQWLINGSPVDGRHTPSRAVRYHTPAKLFVTTPQAKLSPLSQVIRYHTPSEVIRYQTPNLDVCYHTLSQMIRYHNPSQVFRYHTPNLPQAKFITNLDVCYHTLSQVVRYHTNPSCSLQHSKPSSPLPHSKPSYLLPNPQAKLFDNVPNPAVRFVTTPHVFFTTLQEGGGGVTGTSSLSVHKIVPMDGARTSSDRISSSCT